ncbi:MAG: Mrp/NBP35 family ATP-binding protein [Deltaproteobacteria bacterium]|nr:Mrp/NBP35 family ATP-binding protein [Deltaproteobacteria bacterium]
MPAVTQEAVLNSLKSIIDPDLGRDIVSLGFVKNIRIDGSNVAFTIELTTPACPVKEKFRADAEAAVRAIGGISKVDVEMTSNVRSSTSAAQQNPAPQIRNIIAVASGKGGVGKSSVAVNLALALSQQGARAGLMDADFYGPSIPQMLDVGKQDLRQVGDKILPARKYGIEILSFGFFIDQREPVIWRGPMLDGAIRQFFTDVQWSELDYLVVDMPPGTGDVQLSLCQRVPVTGAVMVTTPQTVSLNDVYKGVAMFQKVNVPVLGVVENMSYFECPSCHTHTEIFDSGGGQKLADETGTPLLARLPILLPIRKGGDKGVPAVADPVNTAEIRAFGELAQKVAARISTLQATQAPPNIQIEMG